MTDIIIAFLGLLATAISSVLTYFFTKRKYNAEVDSQKIKNMHSLLDFYIKLCNDTNNRILELTRECDMLREKIEKLDIKIMKLQGKVCYRQNCM